MKDINYKVTHIR